MLNYEQAKKLRHKRELKQKTLTIEQCKVMSRVDIEKAISDNRKRISDTWQKYQDPPQRGSESRQLRELTRNLRIENRAMEDYLNGYA